MKRRNEGKSELQFLENQFRESLEKSRLLGPTTFIMEDLEVKDPSLRNTFQEKINLMTDTIWSMAPDAGSFVIAHQSDYDGESDTYTQICVYSGPGKLITRIPIEENGRLNKLHITPEEAIVAVFNEGIICTYNLRGDNLSRFDFRHKGDKQDEDAAESYFQVQLCAFWASGFFIIDGEGDVYICDDLAQLQPTLFSKCTGTLDGCVALAGNSELKFGPQLWVWDRNNQIILIQKESVQKVQFEYRVEEIRFSPSRKYAVVRAEQHYYIYDGLLRNLMLKYSLEDIRHVNYMVWCGDDTIGIVHGNNMSMIGAADNVISWQLDSSIAAATEIDGIRIITETGVKLLRAIGEAPLQMALWNTKSVIVKLFTKMLDDDYLARNDPVNEFTLDELQNALDGLMESAKFFTKSEQRLALMKVISRTMIQLEKPKDDGSPRSEQLIMLRDFHSFADTLSKLRVVEQLNREPYSMQITPPEVAHLTDPVIVKRLCNRSLHVEAYRVANFLGADTEYISAHWANCLVRCESPDVVMEKIQNRSKNLPPIDLIDLATTAFEIDRKESEDIALRLLQYNRSKAKGVPLLILRGDWKEALKYAVESFDTNLMLYAFNEAKIQEETELLMQTLTENEVARAIWVKFLEGKDRAEVLSLVGQEGYELLKHYILFQGEDGEDELKASLKKNKNPFIDSLYVMNKKLISIKKWLRNRNEGLPDELEEETGNAFLDFFKKKDGEERKPIDWSIFKRGGKSDEPKKEQPKKDEESEHSKDKSERADEEESAKSEEDKDGEEDEAEEQKKQSWLEKRKAKKEAKKKSKEAEENKEEPVDSKAGDEMPEGDAPADIFVGSNVQLNTGEEQAQDDEQKPPPQDKFDLMTPLELFEKVVLIGESSKIKYMVQILGMGKEEALWNRFFIALRHDKMSVLKLMAEEVRPADLAPLKKYCLKRNKQREAEYLSGKDPDAEAEEKRQKQKRARGKKR